jgi:hypothetical protein
VEKPPLRPLVFLDPREFNLDALGRDLGCQRRPQLAMDANDRGYVDVVGGNAKRKAAIEALAEKYVAAADLLPEANAT